MAQYVARKERLKNFYRIERLAQLVKELKANPPKHPEEVIVENGYILPVLRGAPDTVTPDTEQNKRPRSS